MQKCVEEHNSKKPPFIFLKAWYRLLEEPDVTFAALMEPHLQQSREQANASCVVLLVQDTTDIDLSHRHKISRVGHIGNERGRGFFVQTVLTVRPQAREVLGCLANWVISPSTIDARIFVPPGVTCTTWRPSDRFSEEILSLVKVGSNTACTT